MPLAEPPTPPSLLDPAGVWVFDWVVPIAGSLVVLLAVADSVRRRRPTWGLLFLVNSMLVFWMETMGDWGQQLVYSPAFAEHHLLDWLPVKTPHDPVFMPFAYAVYWTVHALAVLWLGQWLSRRYGWGLLRSVVVLAVPVNYAWDLLVEGAATAAGWWTYDPGLGPVWEWGNGGRITLLWTVGLMCVWPNLIAYWAGKPPVHGLNHLERFAGLDRWVRPKPVGDPPGAAAPAAPDAPAAARGTGRSSVAVLAEPAAPARRTRQQEYDAALGYEVTVARWKFELARAAAWFVGFQLSFLVLLVLPLVAERVITGVDSSYVP